MKLPRACADGGRATLVGSAGGRLTPHDAAQLGAAFARELEKFDAGAVLPALDGLREKQRAQLAKMGVPGLGGEVRACVYARMQLTGAARGQGDAGAGGPRRRLSGEACLPRAARRIHTRE
jgi:hypothetical protein